jgi:hypothetical protein
MDLIEAEFDHRKARKATQSRLRSEADELLAWLRGEHPHLPAPTTKTIENRIRAAHREWKRVN